MKSSYEKVRDFLLLQIKFITKNRKNLIITWVCLVLLWYWLYSILGKSDSTTSREISTTIKKWDIKSSIKVIWSSELVSEQTLRFTQQWKITAVYVKAWDKIKKWQLIAELDKQSVKNKIRQAELQLQNARFKLQEILDWNDKSQILQAENNLEQAKLKLETSQKTYDNLVFEKNNFIADKSTYVWSVDYSNQKTINATVLDIQNSLYDGEEILNMLDNIFWVTERYQNQNDTFEIYLSARNSSYKTETESNLLSAYNYKKTLSEFIDTNKTTMSTDKVILINWLNTSKDFYNKLYETLNSAYNALENSVSSTTFTQSTIDSYKNSVSSARSKVKSKLDAIDSAKVQISNLSDIINTENDYQQELQTKEINIRSKEIELQNQKKMMEIYKEILDDTKKWSSDLQIAMSKNDIINSQLSLEIAKDDLDKYELTAPFDGIVRKIDFKVWDNLTNDEDKYVYLENPNIIQITALLDQIDIVKVKKSQNVEIIFDSYTDTTLTWYIEDIDSTPEKTSWVTSYQVTIWVDKWNLAIYGWMSAKAYIIINEKKDILLVPNTYITEIWDKKIVKLSKNWTLKNQFISVWITDWSFTEVLWWLTEWDKIVKEITTSSANKSSSIMWWGWFPWAGWWTRPAWWFTRPWQ